MIDTPQEAMIGDKAARDLLAHEKKVLIGADRRGKSMFFANIQQAFTDQQLEVEKLKAVNAELQKENDRLKRVYTMLNEIVSNHCIAMQSAIIEAEINGGEEGMKWIANTLIGPGLFPDVEEAKSIGGAQAWFDRESAKEAARVAVIKEAEAL